MLVFCVSTSCTKDKVFCVLQQLFECCMAMTEEMAREVHKKKSPKALCSVTGLEACWQLR